MKLSDDPPPNTKYLYCIIHDRGNYCKHLTQKTNNTGYECSQYDYCQIKYTGAIDEAIEISEDDNRYTWYKNLSQPIKEDSTICSSLTSELIFCK